MSNPLKKLAGQTVIYGLGTILPRFLNYMLTPILTRQFLPAEYGINSELYAYIAFLNIIFTYGMETTFFNFNAKLDNKQSVYNTAFTSLLCSSLIFSLILFVFSNSISQMLSTPNAVYPTQFITWSILIMASDALMVIPFARLRAENKALHFSLLKLLNVAVNFGLTIFFVHFCKLAYQHDENNFMSVLYNPEIGIGYVFLANVIANFVTMIFLSKQIFAAQLKPDFALLKQMLVYTAPLIILGFAGMINETLDRIILKKLLPDKAEAQMAQGIYGACYKIAILMTIFIQAFRFAAEPFFFGKAKEKDSKKIYAIVMKYFVIFCLFLFLATVMNLDWIKYFIGRSYWEGLKVVPILLLANLCLGVMYNLSIWYKLSNQTKYGAIISVFGAVITIVINVMFVPKFSYVACAWATLAAYAGMMLLSYFLGQKYFPIKYNLRAMTIYTVISILLFFISRSYSGMENATLKLILNNLLILLFVWLIYKLEISTLKKFKANANDNQSHQSI
ncbi:MAG: oligosaccharide flippase family protein [Bacteroidetes bacterium]|nr:oligosaccharide flippase family protein [Bacteroidota bacterium]